MKRFVPVAACAAVLLVAAWASPAQAMRIAPDGAGSPPTAAPPSGDVLFRDLVDYVQRNAPSGVFWSFVWPSPPFWIDAERWRDETPAPPDALKRHPDFHFYSFGDGAPLRIEVDGGALSSSARVSVDEVPLRESLLRDGRLEAVTVLLVRAGASEQPVQPAAPAEGRGGLAFDGWLWNPAPHAVPGSPCPAPGDSALLPVLGELISPGGCPVTIAGP